MFIVVFIKRVPKHEADQMLINRKMDFLKMLNLYAMKYITAKKKNKLLM